MSVGECCNQVTIIVRLPVERRHLSGFHGKDKGRQLCQWPLHAGSRVYPLNPLSFLICSCVSGVLTIRTIRV